MTRPGTPTLSVQLECLFRRFPILCGICGERLDWDEPRDWDHLTEWADTHDNSPANYRPVHPQPCHRIKSARAETQRSRIDRLERETAGLPKRKRPKKKITAKQDFQWPKRKMGRVG